MQVNSGNWPHVLSGENPVDLLSQGMRRIFGGIISTGCGGIMIPKELPEGRAPVCVIVTMERDPELDAFYRYSNYKRV